MNDIQLALLLSSRICHDLISPVGAVNNGLELLAEDEDDPTMRAEALDLIRASATQASSKIQFMRVAFGAAGAMAEKIRLDQPRELALSLCASNGVRLDWTLNEVTLDKDVVRLLLNFILIGFEALPRGGVLRVGVRKEGATNLMISAEGSKARLSAEAVEVLRNGADLNELEPRQSNLYLAHRIAQTLDASIQCIIEDEVVQVAATL